MPTYRSYEFGGSSKYGPEYRELEQQRRFAEALRGQGLEGPAPSGKMVGELFSPTSPLVGVNKILQALFGSMGVEKSGKDVETLTTRMGDDRTRSIAQALEQAKGTPEISNAMGPGRPEMPGDIPGAMMSLLGSGDPALAQTAAVLPMLQPPKPPGPVSMAPGATLYQPGQGPLYTAPNKPGAAEQQSPIARLIAERDALPPGSPERATYDAAIQKASTHQDPIKIENYPAPSPALNPQTGQVELVQFGNRGTPRSTGLQPPPPTREPKQPTDTERMASGYADRMIASEGIIDKIGAPGQPTYGTHGASQFGKMAEGIVQNPAQRQYRQAQADWVRAKLRKESGAVIAEEEMASEIRTYFPMPWDDPGTVKQKADARKIAIQAMMQQGGRAINQPRPQMPQQGGSLTPEEQKELDELRRRFGR